MAKQKIISKNIIIDTIKKTDEGFMSTCWDSKKQVMIVSNSEWTGYDEKGGRTYSLKSSKRFSFPIKGQH
jgi:hypothetical protein